MWPEGLWISLISVPTSFDGNPDAICSSKMVTVFHRTPKVSRLFFSVCWLCVYLYGDEEREIVFPCSEKSDVKGSPSFVQLSFFHNYLADLRPKFQTGSKNSFCENWHLLSKIAVFEKSNVWPICWHSLNWVSCSFHQWIQRLFFAVAVLVYNFVIFFIMENFLYLWTKTIELFCKRVPITLKLGDF